MPISIDDRLAVKSSNCRERQSAEPSPSAPPISLRPHLGEGGKIPHSFDDLAATLVSLFVTLAGGEAQSLVQRISVGKMCRAGHLSSL